MMKSFACVLAAALLLSNSVLVGNVSAQQLQPIDGIAVVVDEDVVLKSELQRAVAGIRTQYAGRTDQLPPADVLEKQVLERLVLVKLQVARAQGSGLRVTDQEVDQTIAGIAQQNKISVEQMTQQLAREGTSYADFRNSIRDELTVQRFRQRFAQGRINVSEGEVDAALAAQKNSGTQYHLAHILVAMPEGATAEQIATAEKKVAGVQGLIGRGEMNFAAAAVRYSDSPNALEGGDLGWRSLDEIPAAFATLVREMKPGQVSTPLRGPSGFQLLQVVEVRDAAQGEQRMVTQYNARHILVRVTDQQTDAQARAKTETLRARIAGGADFVTVAKESSEDVNTQGRGGDLGWFTEDQFGPEFGGAVTALLDNQVSPQLIKTPAGYHIVQRIGSRQTDVSDDNRRAQVRETIGRRKLEDEWNRYLRELRGEAYIDVRVGAAAETKPETSPAPVPAPAAA